MKKIELIEFLPRTFDRQDIPDDIAEKLWHNYNQKISVEFPSLKTKDKWKLTSKGWVGHILITPDFHIILHPKISIYNIFGMLEYAYNIKSFQWLNGLIKCEKLEEFYNRLVEILTQKIINRIHQGIYRNYLSKTDNLVYLRGRINLHQTIQKPWHITLKCEYQEYTVDVEENQILAWTLFLISRSGLCQGITLIKVRQCYHVLQGLVTLKPFKAEACLNRKYNRLNQDYQELHALCRFFLANTGPSYEKGNNLTIPFLVNMAQLYQLFVAEWLKKHLPENLGITTQKRLKIGNDISFNLDILIYDKTNNATLYIIDTKYKNTLVTDDIQQIIAYAVSVNCSQAVLVYPVIINNPVNQQIGNIQIHLLTFALDDNLEKAGQTFLNKLINIY